MNGVCRLRDVQVIKSQSDNRRDCTVIYCHYKLLLFKATCYKHVEKYTSIHILKELHSLTFSGFYSTKYTTVENSLMCRMCNMKKNNKWEEQNLIAFSNLKTKAQKKNQGLCNIHPSSYLCPHRILTSYIMQMKQS